ncbi:acyltransferase family protein [Polynucleobacter kasalickyi]|uniref:Peptidoglycan/LPS O-acetylase OafA/YrhL, contains acyltransferase and SGNH-hydrolase domains n=1 Tax=Polynucleobacter kasalickyi TaxID=1938817 RepID=A0A1W2A514_9BURK|nr:acyltransferase family protein [Polynucleobacter kasalickyi]SMC55673.1 Peptidoglycan/LPS O-acetylase OafA/YrhL, contains acyltransferase and SGNH-hydrolase domains [Polynucleobacter kasalickyi]
MTNTSYWYRPEIDGLRALAVINVIAYHAFPEVFPWGFLGVDIFFVISGFLITSLITNDLTQGKFNLSLFYSRRIKRLFPALIIVILACFAFSWFAFYAKEFAVLGKHIFAALGFFLNFVLWQESGYFDTQAMTKPLLHLWSLSVEIQFYVFWPVLLWAAFKYQFNLLRLAFIVLLISIGFNIFFLSKDINGAFYLSFNRFWEFQVGSICALLSFQYQSILTKWKLEYADYVIGLGVVLFTLVILLANTHQTHSVLLGILTTLGTLSFILFSQDSAIIKHTLANPMMVWVGIISYPLYLWHWPLISFGQIITNGRLSASYKLELIGLAVLLAYLTYRFIERHVRYGTKKVTIILVLLLVFIASQGWSVYSRDGLSFREKHIKDAFGGRPPQVDKACLKNFDQYTPKFCRSSDESSPVEIALIGDSIAHNSYEGLASVYKLEGKKIVMLGWPGQKPLLKNIDSQVLQNDTSEQMHRLITGLIHDQKVKTMILSMRAPHVSDRTSFLRDLRSTISEMKNYGKQVIFIYPPPEINFDPIECVGMPPFRPVLRSKCSQAVSEIPQHFFEWRAELKQLLSQMQIKTFDTFPVVCSANECQIQSQDGMLLYRERGYLTTSGSIQVFKDFQGSLILPP